MVHNLQDCFNFKISTYNDFEREYSDAFKKAAKEVKLSFPEKLAFILRPLFRKTLVITHASIGIYITLLFFLYCILCALCFKWLEEDYSHRRRIDYIEIKQMKRAMFYQIVCNECQESIVCTNKSILSNMIFEYEQHLTDYSLEFRDEEHPWPWTFGHCFAFVIWVYSTIGDGKMYPLTPLGRVFCMISSLVGIPLFLLVMTYHGRAINEFFKLLYNNLNDLNRYPSMMVTPENLRENIESGQSTTNPPASPGPATFTLKFEESDDDMESYREAHLQDDSPSSTPMTTTSTKKPKTGHNRKVSMAEMIIHFPRPDWRSRFPEHISILPTTAAFIILFVYVLLGGVFIRYNFENWNFLTCFYYLYITMTTIGFGDVDPWVNFTIFHFVYIFIGIAMFAMVLESMKEAFRENFRNGMQKILIHMKVIPMTGNVVIVPDEPTKITTNRPQRVRTRKRKLQVSATSIS